MQLTKIIDPRDNLGRMSRDELWDFAVANRVPLKFDQSTATKAYLETELRSRGITNARAAIRVQGRPTGEFYPPDGSTVTIESPKVTEVDAYSDMIRQMEGSGAKADDRPKSVAEMNMTALRAECRRRGVKMVRTDNVQSLREKLG